MSILEAFSPKLSPIPSSNYFKAIISKNKDNEALRITLSCLMISKQVYKDLGMEVANKSCCEDKYEMCEAFLFI